jgi:hypothetical protein
MQERNMWNLDDLTNIIVSGDKISNNEPDSHSGLPDGN